MSTFIINQESVQQSSSVINNNNGGYRSLLSKPARLFQRSNKTAPLVENNNNIDAKIASSSVKPIEIPNKKNNKKNKNKLSLALKETANNDIFKLSTINDSGFFLPPSPCEDSKRDHWLDIDQDELAFRMPSPDRLTTHSGEKHCFFTPSTTM
ncbi:hypothetical protein BDA99DRAFT_543370 [Phascolomyces articulosus]|uniref:Uncharacterized protein n=1 Tax=Phascolomyces articulosus TaxID=60185 RepID=A0AAD5P9L0_9FUNG|nr:hypothetical protein BDA99DRAFT_543370 [Phascolomyces articulosus]